MPKATSALRSRPDKRIHMGLHPIIEMRRAKQRNGAAHPASTGVVAVPKESLTGGHANHDITLAWASRGVPPLA
jgi:hypothetical protein